jgi:co-chaperonin GroES (HSP10)
MSVASARKTSQISLAKDPKQALLDAVGDLSGYDIFHNQVLVAIYVRPNITAGGVWRPDDNIKEDEYQGKVGLVVKLGPTAFKDTEDETFDGQSLNIGDWVVFRTGDGWQLNIRDTACRILSDRTIRMRIKNPGDIF